MAVLIKVVKKVRELVLTLVSPCSWVCALVQGRGIAQEARFFKIPRYQARSYALSTLISPAALLSYIERSSISSSFMFKYNVYHRSFFPMLPWLCGL